MLDILSSALGVEGVLHPEGFKKLLHYAGGLSLFGAFSLETHNDALQTSLDDVALGNFALTVYSSILVNSRMALGESHAFFDVFQDSIIDPGRFNRAAFGQLLELGSSHKLESNPLLAVGVAIRFFIVELKPMINNISELAAQQSKQSN